MNWYNRLKITTVINHRQWQKKQGGTDERDSHSKFFSVLHSCSASIAYLLWVAIFKHSCIVSSNVFQIHNTLYSIININTWCHYCILQYMSCSTILTPSAIVVQISNAPCTFCSTNWTFKLHYIRKQSVLLDGPWYTTQKKILLKTSSKITGNCPSSALLPNIPPPSGKV